MTTQLERIELAKKEQRDVSSGSYQFGFHDEEAPTLKVERGLSEQTVRQISQIKDEPQWMLDFRLRGYKQFERKPVPEWGGDLSTLDFQNIHY
ncbi:MAG TPA: Fe-S cluster assembly protein SufB, partial [Dehalococcoidia bacterium]|nr:Fe-S cluster assembly protein SufB [Dehalococcoidia bacterium]